MELDSRWFMELELWIVPLQLWNCLGCLAGFRLKEILSVSICFPLFPSIYLSVSLFLLLLLFLFLLLLPFVAHTCAYFVFIFHLHCFLLILFYPSLPFPSPLFSSRHSFPHFLFPLLVILLYIVLYYYTFLHVPFLAISSLSSILFFWRIFFYSFPLLFSFITILSLFLSLLFQYFLISLSSLLSLFFFIPTLPFLPCFSPPSLFPFFRFQILIHFYFFAFLPILSPILWFHSFALCSSLTFLHSHFLLFLFYQLYSSSTLFE